MIALIAAKLTNWLRKYVSMTEDEFGVYQYAFDIAIYTLLSTAGLLCIGIVAGHLIPTVICICVFYLNQTCGGGYHAHSHGGCFMTMALGLLIYLLLLSFQPDLQSCCMAATFSFGALMIKPLVLHENKRYLEHKRKKLETRSRMITLIEIIGFILLLSVNNLLLLMSASLSLLLCAISRIAALFVSKRHS